MLTFPSCQSMLYSLKSAWTRLHSLYNCCIICKEPDEWINEVCYTPNKYCLHDYNKTKPLPNHPPNLHHFFPKSSITFNTGNHIFGKLSANYTFITELSFGKSEESVTQAHFSSANQSKCRRWINTFSKYTCHIDQKLHSFRYWTLTSMQVHLKHGCVAPLVSRFEAQTIHIIKLLGWLVLMSITS